MRGRWAGWLLLAACGGEVVAPVEDSEAALDSEVAPVESDSERAVDSELVVDTGEPVWSTCAPSLPDGSCPGGTVCEEGRCVVDLDPGAPVEGDPVARWEALWSWLEVRYPLFETQPVDWAALREPTGVALAAAGTAFEVSRRVQEALGAVTDGHVRTEDPAICAYDPGYLGRQSNTGACLAEVDGALIVLEAEAGTDWRAGDRLLRIDGRAADDLLNDRLAQPACVRAWSTEASRRATAVASLLFRAGGERAAWVERAGRVVRVPLPSRVPRMCPGRLPLAGERAVGGGVVRADLPGGVVLFDLRQLGAGTPDGFSDLPMREALAAELAGLPADTPVVIDLRGNRGGYSSVLIDLANRWLPDHTLLWSCAVRSDDTPEMPAPVPVYSVGGEAVDTRPVAILLDPISSGSAERVPWALQVAGRALVVGAESEGAIGTVYRVPVEGFTAYVNADLCLDTGGVPLEGRGVPVDLPVGWSRADVEAGTDTVVEAARRALLGP